MYEIDFVPPCGFGRLRRPLHGVRPVLASLGRRPKPYTPADLEYLHYIITLPDLN